MKFSQRIGITPVSKEMQIESIDDELRNGLWNIVKLLYLDKLQKYPHFEESEFIFFAKTTWHDFYKLPVDNIPERADQIEAVIRSTFFSFQWFEVYDFIDFLIKQAFLRHHLEGFKQGINKVLVREFAGYRIVDEQVAPFSNELETKEIEKAIYFASNLTALEGANIHLVKALEFISDKKSPNYRNSIKESISAVEATCRIITGESTLGKALKNLESSGFSINGQLKEGFEKIYAYTNDRKSGIRHAIVDQPEEPDLHDAKYMLVASSSFINYLIGKAGQAGLEIQ